MQQLSYQEQLWSIMIQTYPKNSDLNALLISKPYQCLSTFLSQKTHESSNASMIRIRSSRLLQQNTQNIQQKFIQKTQYTQLIQKAQSLKNKKLINRSSINNFATNLFNTLEHDLKCLNEIEELFNQHNSQLILTLSQIQNQFEELSIKCIDKISKIQQIDQLNSFLSKQLCEYHQISKKFTKITKKQLVYYQTILSNSKVDNMLLQDYDPIQYLESIPQLVEVLQKVKNLSISQFQTYNRTSYQQDGSQQVYNYLYKMGEVLKDIGSFCGGQQSLLNKVLFVGWKTKQKIILAFSKIYNKYICSNIQQEVCISIDEEQCLQFRCQGILTQIMIQIYKLHMLDSCKFYEKNISKIKNQIGSNISQIISILNNTSIQQKFVMSKLQKHENQAKNIAQKVQYLRLLILGVKNTFLTKILKQKQLQVLQDLQKISYLCQQIQQLVGNQYSILLEYWKSMSVIVKECRIIKNQMQKMSKSGTKIHHSVQICQKIEIRFATIDQKLSNCMSYLKINKNTQKRSVIMKNCQNYVQNKTKQVKSLKQKLLLLQLDIYPSKTVQEDIKNSDYKKFDSRIIENQSYAQIPMNSTKKSINFIKSAQISRIQKQQNISSNNSQQIEIPLTNRKISFTKNNLSKALKLIDNFQVNSSNQSQCNMILSQTSSFFQDKLKKMLINGYFAFYNHLNNQQQAIKNYQEDQTLQMRNSNRLSGSQNIHRQSINVYLEYSKRVQNIKNQVDFQINQIMQFIQPNKNLSLTQFEPSIQDIPKNQIIHQRQSMIRIQVQQDQQEEYSYDKNNNKKFGLNLSRLKQLDGQKASMIESRQQLKLTIINLYLLQQFLAFQPVQNQLKQQVVPKKKTNYQHIKQKRSLHEVIQSHLNFQYQNWKQNIHGVEFYISHSLQSFAQSYRHTVQTYSRSIFSNNYILFRDSINLIEVILDILAEMIQIYKQTKQYQMKNNFNYTVINLNEKDCAYIALLYGEMVQMQDECEQLKDFKQIPQSIRNYLHRIYHNFIMNFKTHLGSHLTPQILQKIAQKLEIAITFKTNHEKIFEMFILTVNKNINQANKLCVSKDSTPHHRERALLIVKQIHEISQQIKHIDEQNKAFIKMERQIKNFRIQGVLQFQELNYSYHQYYQLADYILGKVKKNYKWGELRFKRIAQSVENLYKSLKLSS